MKEPSVQREQSVKSLAINRPGEGSGGRSQTSRAVENRLTLIQKSNFLNDCSD